MKKKHVVGVSSMYILTIRSTLNGSQHMVNTITTVTIIFTICNWSKKIVRVNQAQPSHIYTTTTNKCMQCTTKTLKPHMHDNNPPPPACVWFLTAKEDTMTNTYLYSTIYVFFCNRRRHMWYNTTPSHTRVPCQRTFICICRQTSNFVNILYGCKCLIIMYRFYNVCTYIHSVIWWGVVIWCDKVWKCDRSRYVDISNQDQDMGCLYRFLYIKKNCMWNQYKRYVEIV